MPNNENNNLFNNDNNNTQSNPNINFQNIQFQQLEQQNPKQTMEQIEIPQVYNEKIAKEEIQTQSKPVVEKENGVNPIVFLLSIINAIVIFVIFYATVNKNVLISVGIIIYVVILSIIFAIKDKQKSVFPTSIIIGGMLSSVICFVLSMLSEKQMDLWTYYTIACAATGMIGLIVSNMLTNLFAKAKEIKALQTIGYLLFFAALVAVPYFAYKKWPTEFYQIVFYQKNEVIADTYEEYVLKTLKARYSLNFTCDFKNKKNYKTEKNEIMSTMTCQDPNNNTISIRTLPYNESAHQYTIIDDFIENIYLKEIKETISSEVKEATGATIITTYLYPKQGCMFVGDCADCEDYYKVYKEVNDSKNRFEISSNLNLSKYLNLSNEEFVSNYINENEFKVILHIKGSYTKDSTDFTAISKQVFNILNSIGLKNNYGYEITYYDLQDNTYEVKVNKTTGQTNETKEFK